MATSTESGPSLGAMMNHSNSVFTEDTVDHYHKNDESTCVMMYMSVIIGIGSYDLPRATAKCGVIPGMLILIGMNYVHYFICCRMVEVPVFLEKDLHSFADMVTSCFNRAAWVIVGILSASSWGFACVYTLRRSIWTLALVFESPQLLLPRFPSMLVFGILMMPFAFGSRAKDMRNTSKLGLLAMFLAMFTEIGFGLVQAARGTETLSYSWFGMWADICDGTYLMTRAFFGIAMFPYVLVEMVSPDNGKVMAFRACRNISMWFIAVALFGYLAWGDQMKDDNRKEEILALLASGGTSMRVVQLCGILTMVITLSLYPLYLWPLCRELEGLLGWRSAPVLLRLPWALRRLRRNKIMMRVGLVIATLLPQQLSTAVLKPVTKFFIALPLPMMNSLVPSVLALKAIIIHWRFLRDRGEEAMQNKSYWCGHIRAHTVATAVVAVVTSAFVVYSSSVEITTWNIGY